MTYMSIKDEIRDRVSEQRLFPVEPVLGPIERPLFVSSEINDLLEGPWESPDMERRCGFLRAELNGFASSRIISMCLTPFTAKDAFLGLLNPPGHGVWDMRSQDPSPGIRLIGGFADVDWFVALEWAPRSVAVEWSSKKPLGDRNSREWRRAILSCKAQWRQLFAAYPTVKGSKTSDFVSKDTLLV